MNGSNGKNGNGNVVAEKRVKFLTRAIAVIASLLLLTIGSVIFLGVKYWPAISDIKSVQGEVNQLREDYKFIVAEAKKLEEEKAKLTKELAGAKTSLDEANKNLDAKTKQASYLAKSLSGEQAKNKKLASSNAKTAEEVRLALVARDSALREKNILSAEKESFNGEKADLVNKIADLEKEKDSLQADLAKKQTLSDDEGIVVAKSGSEQMQELQREIATATAERNFMDAASLVAHAPPGALEKDSLKVLNELKNAAAWFLTKAANQGHSQRLIIGEQTMAKISQVKKTAGDKLNSLPEKHQKSLLSLEKRWQHWQSLRI